MKKSMIALAVSGMLGVGAQAATLNPGTTYDMFILADGTSCFTFGDCTTGLGTFVDNDNNASTPGFGSAIGGDTYAGVINISTTDNGAGGVNFTINSFNMDSYLATSGGVFNTQMTNTTNAGGSVDASGSISLDLTGRQGLAEFFIGAIGIQPWNIDDAASINATTGNFELFTTGSSSNIDKNTQLPLLTLTGTPLDVALTATLVSAGNVGASWLLFDGTPYSEVFSVQFQAVPVPAAVWLFGSGLIGLVGVARRKKA